LVQDVLAQTPAKVISSGNCGNMVAGLVASMGDISLGRNDFGRALRYIDEFDVYRRNPHRG